MKKTILFALMLFVGLAAKAQGVDSLFFDARGSYNQFIKDDSHSSTLRADYLNLHIYGKISDNLSYRVRQRLNVAIDSENPFRATDWMWLSWKASDRWSLSTGKGAVLIGGYEYDSAPIDVYYYSQFCSNLGQYFAFGVNAAYNVRPDQNIVFQICNSPLTSGFSDCYAYNLAWNGNFAPWWETIWSFNLIEDPYKRMMNYVALGNHFLFNDLALDVDIFHRASFDQARYLFTDYSIISKLIWSIGKWNICTKVGYESNAAENVDGNGLSFDTCLRAGSSYTYGGCGIEYFPLGRDDVRLHAAWFTDSFDHTNTIQIGVKWKFMITKR